MTGNKAYRTISLGSSKNDSKNLIIQQLRSGQQMASKSSQRMALMSQKENSHMKTTTTPNHISDGSPIPLARTVQTKAPIGRVRLPKEAYM